MYNDSLSTQRTCKNLIVKTLYKTGFEILNSRILIFLIKTKKIDNKC